MQLTLEQRIKRAQALLAHIEHDFAPAVLATSFAAEGMVLVDLIAKENPGLDIITLDTGRLPQESYALMEHVSHRYRRKIKVFFPDTRALERYVRLNGVNGFYDSAAQRLQCCDVRKVEPLKRALAGKKAWITGLRRGQSATRESLLEREHDATHGLQKFNPLIDWSTQDVWAYIKANDVPYNALHDQGHPSIGCAPCTRAIEPGEDMRAGRWWWETVHHKECGLHLLAHA